MARTPKHRRLNFLPKKKHQSDRKWKNPWYNTHRWRELRSLFLNENPLCVECEKEGLAILGNVVDHKQRVASGKTDAEKQRLMWDWDNLQTMCDTCHNSKSGKEAHH